VVEAEGNSGALPGLPKRGLFEARARMVLAELEIYRSVPARFEPATEDVLDQCKEDFCSLLLVFQVRVAEFSPLGL
jgi:hypothetical protein